jgi:hypothetical protein
MAVVALAADRPHMLREAILCCRKGGTVSVPGIYIGFPDKIPFGAAMNKGERRHGGVRFSDSETASTWSRLFCRPLYRIRREVLAAESVTEEKKWCAIQGSNL